MQHYSHHPDDPLEIAKRPCNICKLAALALLTGIGLVATAWAIKDHSERLSRLEHTVEIGLGSEWPVLTEAQSKLLSDALKGITQPKTLIVMYHNPLGLALSDSIADAFRKGGWHDVVLIPGIVAEPGLGTGHLTGMAGTLKKVIEDATGYKLVSYGPESEQGLLFVAVGVKR